MLGSDMRKLFQKLLTLALLTGALAFVGAPSKASATNTCGECDTSYTTCSQRNGDLAGVTACRDAHATCAASCTANTSDAGSLCVSKAQSCNTSAEANYDVCRSTCAGDTECIATCNENRAASHTSCKATQDGCSAAASD